MLLKIQTYLEKVKAVTVDGALYVLIAIFGSLVTITTSDDAYKYWNPYVLYFTKCITEIALAAVGALKMFRSTSYSKHIEQKKQNEKTITNLTVNTGP